MNSNTKPLSSSIQQLFTVIQDTMYNYYFAKFDQYTYDELFNIAPQLLINDDTQLISYNNDVPIKRDYLLRDLPKISNNDYRKEFLLSQIALHKSIMHVYSCKQSFME